MTVEIEEKKKIDLHTMCWTLRITSRTTATITMRTKRIVAKNHKYHKVNGHAMNV